MSVHVVLTSSMLSSTMGLTRCCSKDVPAAPIRSLQLAPGKRACICSVTSASVWPSFASSSERMGCCDSPASFKLLCVDCSVTVGSCGLAGCAASECGRACSLAGCTTAAEVEGFWAVAGSCHRLQHANNRLCTSVRRQGLLTQQFWQCSINRK